MHYLRTQAWHEARMAELARHQRGFIINPFLSAAAATDPYWANVVLLLPCQGTHGSTTVTDVSTTPHTVTVISTSSIDTSSAPTGATSALRVQTSGGGLEITDHADFDFGSGDFTIETYLFLDTTTIFPIIFNKKNATNFSPFQMLCGNADTLQLYRASNNGTTYGASQSSASAPFGTGTWQHIAYGRTGTTFYSWIAGASMASTVTMSGALTTNTDEFTVGRTGNGTNIIEGRFAYIRVTKGVNRYTTGFTPPTLPMPES